MAERHRRSAKKLTRQREDIKRGNHKKYGYSSAEQARSDLKNWDRIIQNERKIAKRWMKIHNKILTKPVMQSETAKKLIEDGKKYTLRIYTISETM